MPKKSKYITKKDTEKLIEKYMLKYYTASMTNQLTALKNLYDNDVDRKDAIGQVNGLSSQVKALHKHLIVLATEGLANAYALGRITKNELIDSLKEIHKNDMLAVTEQLEEIEQLKDTMLSYLKRELKKKPTPAAFECYHANENPATCPCPKRCYCKDKTCLGKVSW